MKLQAPLFPGVLLWFFLSNPLPADDLSAAFDRMLQACPAELVGAEAGGICTRTVDQDIAAVYHETGLRPLWVSVDGPGEPARSIFHALTHSSEEGLDPADYKVPEIKALWSSQKVDELAKLDALLTLGVAYYVEDMRRGRVQMESPESQIYLHNKHLRNPAVLIEEILSAQDLALFLKNLAPEHHYYQGLRRQLAHYRELAARGGWPYLVAGDTLRPGDRSERILTLRDYLLIVGDSNAAEVVSDLYDEDLELSVKRFQKRHGLQADGLIGKQTLAAMQVSVEQRIRQIEINMERWRWRPNNLGEAGIVADVAGFKLDVINHGQVVLQMPIIVGKHRHETPIFSDQVKYLEFNPYWNIPPSIALKEILPELLANPNYLRDKRIRLFSDWTADAIELNTEQMDWQNVGRQIVLYRLRQEPGKWNALGAVKFVFPNKYNIYMHDTAQVNLFNHSKRNFSHGCIRLGRPMELAELLLSSQAESWDSDKISTIIEAGDRKVVPLDSPVPVHITYQTARVDMDGTLYFSDDLYGRDQQLIEALYAD